MDSPRYVVRGLVAASALALVGVGLGACVAEGTPAPTTGGQSASATETPAAAATLVPDGSAADNLPLFAAVVTATANGPEPVSGRAYIDALVAAGFPKTSMEVTNDRTTVDDPADSIQFSVAWGDECLVGQVGPSTPAPTAVVLPALADGGCLLGETRVIDW